MEDNLRQAYHDIFTSPQGKVVLDDLERIANQTKIDSDNPNPNAAVYKAAQLALLKRINNLIKQGQII